jgi:hypothetical protein
MAPIGRYSEHIFSVRVVGVIWNPLSVAGRLDVLLCAMTHGVPCGSDFVVLLDAK